MENRESVDSRLSFGEHRLGFAHCLQILPVFQGRGLRFVVLVHPESEGVNLVSAFGFHFENVTSLHSDQSVIPVADPASDPVRAVTLD